LNLASATIKEIHAQHLQAVTAAGGQSEDEAWTLEEFVAQVGDFYVAVDSDTSLVSSGTVFTLVDQPFRALVDRRAKKTYLLRMQYVCHSDSAIYP
jgi:hypothetical protein